MPLYSLVHPTQYTLDQIGLNNIEGGKLLLENILRDYGIHNADINIVSATEIRIRAKDPLIAPAMYKLKSICEIREIGDD